MATFLFDQIIFGPVTSRRLGNSLGINLLPVDGKYCNFNCLYCECGLTDKAYGTLKHQLPSRVLVKTELEKKLSEFTQGKKPIDTITFAGNGEPTLHPEFSGIIDDTVELQQKYYPESKIAVLSNATLIGRKDINKSLMKVDYNILKLDSPFDDTLKKINCPMGNFSVKKLVRELRGFPKNLTIQTLFVRGKHKGLHFDNSTDEEVSAWLNILEQLKPELVMVYTFARDTPIDSLEKINSSRLNEIAKRVEQLGIAVSVST